MCPGVDLFRFTFFGTLLDSWIFRSVSFTMLGKLSTIISSNKISAPFSVFLLLGAL